MARCDALSLPELLFSLLLLSLIVSLALPDLGHTLAQRRSDSTMARLAQAIEYARVAAVSSGGTVTLCPSADGGNCGGAWEDGVLIFADSNSDHRLTETDHILRHLVFPDIDGSIRWRSFQNRQYLQISRQGFTRNQNGNFTYCPRNDDAHLARQLIVNRLARVRHAGDFDGDGVREDSSGKPLRCG